MNVSNGVLVFAVLGALLTISNGASAQAPSAIADLVGARASSGETQLEARGYQFIKGNTVRGEKWTFWWSAEQRQCVQVATLDGRYGAIQAVPAANCGQAGEQGSVTAFGRQDEARNEQSTSLTLICYGEGGKPSVEAHSAIGGIQGETAMNPSMRSPTEYRASIRKFRLKSLVSADAFISRESSLPPFIPVATTTGGTWTNSR